MRDGPHCEQTIITLETEMGLSRSAMPPLICLAGLGRVWRLTMDTCSTRILPLRGLTSSTRPVLPLSRPAITFTWSFFFNRILTGSGVFFAPGISDHLRRQRDDFHKTFLAQFARHGAEYTGAHGLTQFRDEDRG